MKQILSLLMITKDAQNTIEKSLDSIKNLVDEIVIVDNYSKVSTVDIAKKYQAMAFLHKEDNLGRLRKFALEKCQGEWILVLDSDEVISAKLSAEIKLKIKSEKLRIYSGFYLPFQNHFLGKPIKYGGESYKKLVLFKKDKATIKPLVVHEKFEVSGKTGILKNKILHYSYRSLAQTYKKFTDYAIRDAKQKYLAGERSGFKKIFLYPIHMFWARFIKDKGYKDGLFRIPLDFGFAYMEFLTYFVLAILRIKNCKFTLII